MKRLAVFLMVAAIALAAFAGFAPANAQSDQTLAQYIESSPDLSTLWTAIQAADESVLKALSEPANAETGGITVFAPTNAAFDALKSEMGEEGFGKLLAEKGQLTTVLMFHVMAEGILPSKAIVETLDEGIKLAGEGYVYQLRSAAGQFVDYAKDANGQITINGAPLNLQMVDIKTSNGIIHVIDAVMFPEFNTMAQIIKTWASADEGANFKTLLAALSAADESILATLDNPETLATILIPTDEAFEALKAAIGEETFNKILADKAGLTDILMYHVEPTKLGTTLGVVNFGAVIDKMGDGKSAQIIMANERPLTVSIIDGALCFEGATKACFVKGNIDASNGLIHIIDGVLVPPPLN